jgi:hypothetical protein
MEFLLKFIAVLSWVFGIIFAMLLFMFIKFYPRKYDAAQILSTIIVLISICYLLVYYKLV